MRNHPIDEHVIATTCTGQICLGKEDKGETNEDKGRPNHKQMYCIIEVNRQARRPHTVSYPIGGEKRIGCVTSDKFKSRDLHAVGSIPYATNPAFGSKRSRQRASRS